MRIPFCVVLILFCVSSAESHEPVRVVTSDVDAAAPVGAPMAYDPVRRIDELILRCRGIAILTTDACHPQSYCRLGIPCPDFPGIARCMHGQSLPESLLVHFDGAGGNITAGKYYDGSFGNRLVLTNRPVDGLRQALLATIRIPLPAADIDRDSVPVALPPAAHLVEADLRARRRSLPPKERVSVADSEGGGETGPTASNVGPSAEAILLNAIRKLLEVP